MFLYFRDSHHRSMSYDRSSYQDRSSNSSSEYARQDKYRPNNSSFRHEDRSRDKHRNRSGFNFNVYQTQYRWCGLGLRSDPDPLWPDLDRTLECNNILTSFTKWILLCSGKCVLISVDWGKMCFHKCGGGGGDYSFQCKTQDITLPETVQKFLLFLSFA